MWTHISPAFPPSSCPLPPISFPLASRFNDSSPYGLLAFDHCPQSSHLPITHPSPVCSHHLPGFVNLPPLIQLPPLFYNPSEFRFISEMWPLHVLLMCCLTRRVTTALCAFLSIIKLFTYKKLSLKMQLRL